MIHNNAPYSYYVYSNSIARYDNTSQNLEIKKHNTNQWEKVNDPIVWRRVQEDGDKVSEKDAEKMYHIFHSNLTKNNNIES
jgi:hypothetical protein